MIRRRKPQKNHRVVKSIFLTIFFLSLVTVGYSYLSANLRIEGSVAGISEDEGFAIANGSNPNLRVDVQITNRWQEGGLYKYQYALNVTNIGTTTFDNFKLTVNFLNIIETITIWNYDYMVSNKTLTITNNNYTLSPQQSVTVSFILATPASRQSIKTIKLEVVESTDEVTLEDFNVNFSISGGWGNYTYQYNVTVTNKTGIKINAWELEVTLAENTSFVGGWSAIYSTSGKILTIKNEKYNGQLNNNASTSFGLQLSTNILNYVPSNIKVMVR